MNLEERRKNLIMQFPGQGKALVLSFPRDLSSSTT
jgi:hypothetical protein